MGILANLELAARRRGIRAYAINRDNWLLADQLTLALEKDGKKETFVLGLNDGLEEKFISDVYAAMDRLDPPVIVPTDDATTLDFCDVNGCCGGE